MKKFYEGVIKARGIIILLFLIAAGICGYCQQFISVNYDINAYLPDDAPSTKALNVMEDEFDGAIPNARVMVKNVTQQQALKYKEKLECLKDGNVFTDSIIESFKYGSLDKWKKELRHRIIHDDIEVLRGYVKLHNKENMDALDEVNWNKISDIKFNIMKDTLTRKSLFTRINEAIDAKDYEKVSSLQLELSKYMKEIRQLYSDYKKNIY